MTGTLRCPLHPPGDHDAVIHHSENCLMVVRGVFDPLLDMFVEDLETVMYYHPRCLSGAEVRESSMKEAVVRHLGKKVRVSFYDRPVPITGTIRSANGTTFVLGTEAGEFDFRYSEVKSIHSPSGGVEDEDHSS